MDIPTIEEGIRLILKGIGEDPGREGLLETPRRVAQMYAELCAGLEADPADHLHVNYTEQHDEMVLLRKIRLFSLCEHHLLPFYGFAHVAYIPRDGKITGLSKLARVVDTLARRPQVQERLTSQIADALMASLNPQGAGVVIEAEHLCLSVRGVRQPGSKAVTSALRGSFRKNPATRAEFFSLIRNPLEP